MTVQMPIITQSELESFIGTYLNRFTKLTSGFSDSQKHLLLPKYLRKKCDIIGTISKTKGVSIRFNATKNKAFIRCKYAEKSIENEALPLLSTDGNVLFIIDGANQVLENVNLITKEFYDTHEELIEKLTRSTNFIMEKPKKFVEIISGDLQLIDCTLGFYKNGKKTLDRIDFLWLFGSNQSSDFSTKRAELLANLQYKKLVSILINRIPIQTLVETLREFKKRIESRNTTETDMQTFFKNNGTLLNISANRIFPKFRLGGDFIPDFIIETSDLQYEIVEIESPNANLYTSGKLPRQARKLREADTQIKNFMNYARNNVLFLRSKLPFLSEEKIRGLIVIGKSSRLSKEQKKKLDQDRAYSKDYDIITYDELFQNLNTFLKNLGLRYSQI